MKKAKFWLFNITVCLLIFVGLFPAEKIFFECSASLSLLMRVILKTLKLTKIYYSSFGCFEFFDFPNSFFYYFFPMYVNQLSRSYAQNCLSIS